MLNTNHLRDILIASTAATLFTACGGGSSLYKGNSVATATGETITLGIDNPVCRYGSSVQEGRVVDSDTNKGVSGVTVEIAGCKSDTDKDGYYKVANIPSSKRVSVNFEKDNYIKYSKIISIKEDTPNYIETSIYKNSASWSFEAQDGSVGKNLEIVADSIFYENNQSKYEGKVNLSYTHTNPATAKGKESFPGTYEGLNQNRIVVNFVSYKMMSLSLKDQENNILQSAQPITINLYNIYQTDDETIPLWFYNEDKGIWEEKGAAYKEERGKYVCKIPHTGTWSLSKPVEQAMGTYKGKIVDENSNPVSSIRLKAQGKNWISHNLSTDENGEFTLYVVPNEEFSLSAYDPKEKFGADFPEKIKGISSGEIVIE